MQNKYQRLAGNTVKLGLGTFGSKVLVFLMVRFYTEYLSPADYGTADLITQTANLLIPLLSLGITDAVFRFVIDEAEGAAGIFTTGFFVLLAGIVLAGIGLSIHAIRAALRKYRSPMVWFILGLMAGSLYAIVMGTAGLDAPQAPVGPQTFDVLGFALGIAILLGLEALRRWTAQHPAQEAPRGKRATT